MKTTLSLALLAVAVALPARCRAFGLEAYYAAVQDRQDHMIKLLQDALSAKGVTPVSCPTARLVTETYGQFKVVCKAALGSSAQDEVLFDESMIEGSSTFGVFKSEKSMLVFGPYLFKEITAERLAGSEANVPTWMIVKTHEKMKAAQDAAIARRVNDAAKADRKARLDAANAKLMQLRQTFGQKFD